MPNMANITVKNAAGTDVVYSAATASAGDKSPARWTANTLSAIPAFRPTITMLTRDSGSGPARLMDINGMFPHLRTVGGVEGIANRTLIKGQFVLPTDVAAADVLDAFTQLGNLVVSQLFRDAASAGYAPT